MASGVWLNICDSPCHRMLFFVCNQLKLGNNAVIRLLVCYYWPLIAFSLHYDRLSSHLRARAVRSETDKHVKESVRQRSLKYVDGTVTSTK